MRCHTLLSTCVAASLVSAHPHQPAKRAVSPDGCQSAFGTCNNGGGTATPSPTQSPTQSPTSSPTSNPGGGGSTRDVPRPKIGPVPYGSVIYDCVNDGDIALTFDDGPYIYTPTVLDVLAEYNVKATFFINGNNGNGEIDKVPQWTEIVRRTYNEGHQIASHTFTHPDLTTLSSAARRDQMYLNEAAIANIIGVFPTYMRPPYLAFDAACEADMADLGYHVVSTNLDTKDYANTTPETVGNAQRTFDDFTARDPASNSFIVLNHDIHRTTAEILTEGEILRLRSRGYRAVTVGQCLGDDPANWYRSVPQPAFRIFNAEPPSGEPASSEDLANAGFSLPAATCNFVEDPASLRRLMGLV